MTMRRRVAELEVLATEILDHLKVTQRQLGEAEKMAALGGLMPLTTQAPGGAGNTPTAPIDDGPTMFDAVRELGLKLESERGPVDHLVIDSVERPTED